MRFKRPGAKGPKVYEWEEARPGVWLRRYVSRAEVRDRWLLYADSQKRYDSFFNEWDLCEAFDPLATTAEAESEDGEDWPPTAPRIDYADSACLPLHSIIILCRRVLGVGVGV